MQRFCLQGKLLSFQKWYEEKEADLVSRSTAHSLSCSFCWRGLCHIQLSKCMRQQSLLVMRALGRDWFLTSSPEIFPTRHEAEMCGDALLSGNSPPTLSNSLSKEPFRPNGQISLRLLSIKTALLLAWLFACTFGPLELHAYQKGVPHSWRNLYA